MPSLSQLEEGAIKEHLALVKEPVPLDQPGAWEARGYFDETGEPTPLGEDYILLKESGLFDDKGNVTPKGQAFALDPYDALQEKNLPLYIIREKSGLNETPEQSFGEMVEGVGGFLGDVVKGGHGLAKSFNLDAIYNPAAAFRDFESDAEEAQREAEGVLARQSAAEGAFEGIATLGAGLERMSGKMWLDADEDEAAYYLSKQKFERAKSDLQDADAAQLYGGLIDSAAAIEGMGQRADAARATVGPERAAEVERQGEAFGSIAGDPSNLATLGVGAAVGAGAKLPIIAQITAKAEQATVAALRAQELAMQLAKARMIADKTSRAAKVAADGAERALVANKGLRGKAFNDTATRLSAVAEQAKASIPMLEQQAADAVAHAQKLAELNGGAQKMVATFQQAQQIGRQIRSAPARVLGPMIEGIGEGVLKTDGWLAANLKGFDSMRTSAALLGVGTGNPMFAIPAAVRAAGPLIKSVGGFTKILGKELMEARGTVPFWQRVAQNTTATPLQRATAHAFDFATLGGKVPTAIKNTAKGMAAAAPVDMAFEVAASGGDLSPNTLKQGLAESLVFGGGGSFAGAMTRGRLNDLRARAAGDEINFRRGLSPEETRRFSLMDKGARNVMAVYGATFPGLKFKLTESGPSMFDRGSNTAVINTKQKDWLRPVIAHEVNHYIQVTGQMEDGIRAMLVGDQGGFLKGKDGKLDPNFREFMDVYNRRAKASGLKPLDVAEAAIEYFNEATVDSLLGDTRSGQLQRRAGRSNGERMVRDLVEATVMKLPIIKDLFFRTGGAMDAKGMVQGNGLLAGGVRELPEARAMMRKVFDQIAGRRRSPFPLSAEAETIRVKPGDPVIQQMVAMYDTDADGNVILNAKGEPTVISEATDKARSEVGKVIIEDMKRRAEFKAAAFDGNQVANPDPLDTSDPIVKEEAESETPEQKSRRVKLKPDGTYDGTHFSPREVQKVRKSGILNKIQALIFRELNRASRDLNGESFTVLVHPATSRKKGSNTPRYDTVQATLRDVVPLKMKMNKKGGLYVELIDLHQLATNIHERAASERGKRLYGGNEMAIREDVEAVLNLHRQGLKPDAYLETKYGKKWEEYKNFLNSILATKTNQQKAANPQIEEDGLKLDSVLKTFRIDRISKATRTRSGKTMPVGPNTYENVKVNYLPEPVPETHEPAPVETKTGPLL